MMKQVRRLVPQGWISWVQLLPPLLIICACRCCQISNMRSYQYVFPKAIVWDYNKKCPNAQTWACPEIHFNDTMSELFQRHWRNYSHLWFLITSMVIQLYTRLGQWAGSSKTQAWSMDWKFIYLLLSTKHYAILDFITHKQQRHFVQ